MSTVAQHKIRDYGPMAAVYFLDKNWNGLTSLQNSSNVIIPEIYDIIDISTRRGVTGVVGNFSITLNNSGDRYFIKDNIDEDISILSTPPAHQALINTEYQKRPYPYKDARDFLDAKFVNLLYSPPGDNNIYPAFSEVNNTTGDTKYYYWKVRPEDLDASTASTADAIELNRTEITGTELTRLEQEARPHSDLYNLYGGDTSKGKPIFEPMQRCVILFSRRIETEKSPYSLITAFTGIVNSVQDTYQENFRKLVISGEDLTKWLRVTLTNMNPAILTENIPEAGADELQIYTKRFANMEGWQIIQALVLGNMDSEKRAIYGAGNYEVIPEYHPSQSVLASQTGAISSDVTSEFGLERSDDNTWIATGENLKTEKGNLFRQDKLHLQLLPGIEMMQGQDGENTGTPYKRFFRQSLNTFSNEFKTNWDIATAVAKETNFEFYADGIGDLWYHQPRFNMQHILTHDTPEAYIIEDEAIITADFTEDDSEVITSMLVTGVMEFVEAEPAILDIKSYYEDIGLVRKYGRRMFTVHHPYLTSNEDCYFFGKSLLYRINAGRFNGSVTIVGRPEINPAWPVYIPYRNMLYYIKSVSHKFTFGSTYTTTLELTYGHKPWEILQEVLDYKTLPPSIAAAIPKDVVVNSAVAGEAASQNISATPGTVSTDRYPLVGARIFEVDPALYRGLGGYILQGNPRAAVFAPFEGTIKMSLDENDNWITIIGTGAYDGYTAQFFGVSPHYLIQEQPVVKNDMLGFSGFLKPVVTDQPDGKIFYAVINRDKGYINPNSIHDPQIPNMGG